MSDRYPELEAPVLVRMADERVVGARWTGTKWDLSRVDRWGDPVAWAALPPLGSGAKAAAMLERERHGEDAI